VGAGGRQRFTVDRELCIGCRLCEERAPENFEVPPGATWSQVFQQPRDEREERACRDAQAYCPAGAVRVEDVPDAP
jgi:ferredoxin